MDNQLKFIGHIETPYNALSECPSNIDFSGPVCKLVLADEYREGLNGLQAKQNVLILYWLGSDLNERKRAVMSQSTHHCSDRVGKTGTFALRSPYRPNPIGAAVMPLVDIEDGTLSVRGLDCLNGTKILDIKPAIMLEDGLNSF